MKNFSLTIAMVVAVGIFAAAPALAGDMQGKGAVKNAVETHGYFEADDLIGKDVLSRQGEEIGEVENLLINENGDVQYILISRFGIFDIGEEYYAAPWSSISTITEENLLLNLSADSVHNSPVFQTEKLTPGWEREIRAYYGDTGPRPEAEMERRGRYREEYRGGFGDTSSAYFQADELIGKTTLSSQGRQVGEIENILIGKDGRAQYLILSRGGIFGIGAEYYVVPFAAVDTVSPDNVMLSLNTRAIMNSPAFESAELGPGWERGVSTYYGDTEMEMDSEMDYRMQRDAESEDETRRPYFRERETERGRMTYLDAGEQQTDEMSMMEEETALRSGFRASNLLGQPVLSQDGSEAGKLQNIIIGENGEIKYAIVSSGGFLGFRQQLVAVPWSMVQPQAEQEAIRVSVTQEKLRNAPTFEQRAYSPEWENQVNAYYGADAGMRMEYEPETGMNSGY